MYCMRRVSTRCTFTVTISYTLPPQNHATTNMASTVSDQYITEGIESHMLMTLTLIHYRYKYNVAKVSRLHTAYFTLRRVGLYFVKHSPYQNII